MIRINLSKKTEIKHLEYYNTNILKNLENCCFDFKEIKIDLLEEHHKFLKYCKENARVLAIGKPKELKKIISDVKNNFPNINRYINKSIDYSDCLLKAFGYEKFIPSKILKNEKITLDNYSGSKFSKFKWSAYHLVFESGIRVCPYCNRQYITPLLTDKGKVRGHLDHFFPKKIFPYLSMSLYNLIPSCQSCNASLKGSHEFAIEDLNPYSDNIGEHFSFIYEPTKKKVSLNIINDSKNISDYLELFKIEDLYSYHKNIAFDLMEKRMIYSENYIEELYKTYENHFINKDKLKELIIGYSSDENKLNEEVLAKLKNDIAKQLGFIEKKDNINVEKLKNLKLEDV